MLENYINSLLTKLTQYINLNNDAELKNTTKTLFNILEDIKDNINDWEVNCKFNLEQLEHHINYDIELHSNDDLHIIVIIIYRFLCEYLFMAQNIDRERYDRLSIFKRSILDIIKYADEKTKSEIEYANYEMIPQLLRYFFRKDEIQYFRKLSQNVIETKNAIENLEKVKKEIDESTNSALDSLNKFKTAFNFVGLYQGFSALAKSKINEKNWLRRYLIGIGIAILSPLFFEIWENSFSNIASTISPSITILKLAPIASIEILLIYYFRVILFNFNSVKTQILQLELRMTLCQFIQDYARYSTEIKKNDKSALEKFENVIFSGLLADVDKLPSTYDGIEQLSQMLKSLKTS